jgi:hypothetical protein
MSGHSQLMRAETFMRAAISQPLGESLPIASPNGMAQVGPALGGGNGMNSYIQILRLTGLRICMLEQLRRGASANRIAKWNRTNWSALGSGWMTYSYVTARR